jgi:hypothetical protein
MIEAGAVEELPLGTLRHDPRVQRALDQRQLRRMVSEWDEASVGIIAVSRREDGDYVVDGNHRVHSKMDRSGAEATIRAEVHHGLTIAQEAELSLRLNDRRNWVALDSFRLRVIGNDPIAVAVNEILRATGWVTSDSPGRGHISAVAACEQVFKGAGIRGADGTHPRALQDTMQIIGEAWGHNPGSAPGVMIKSLGMVILRYGDAIDRGPLVRVLQRSGTAPDALIADAKGLRQFINTSLHMALAETITERYNHRRTSNRLAPWRSR